MSQMGTSSFGIIPVKRRTVRYHAAGNKVLNGCCAVCISYNVLLAVIIRTVEGLMNALNAALKELIADGSIQEILDKYIKAE